MLLLRRIIQQLFLLLLPWMLYSKSLGCCIGLLRWTARPRPWRSSSSWLHKFSFSSYIHILTFFLQHLNWCLSIAVLCVLGGKQQECHKMKWCAIQYGERRGEQSYFAENDLILFSAHNETGKYLSNSSTVLVSLYHVERMFPLRCNVHVEDILFHTLTLFWHVVVEWTKHSIWYHTEHRIDTRDGI